VIERFLCPRGQHGAERLHVTVIIPFTRGYKRSVFDTAAELDVAQLRARLRKMDDTALRKFGMAAAYMASPQATADGSPPRPRLPLAVRGSPSRMAPEAPC
jgi:hypothetical protein